MYQWEVNARNYSVSKDRAHKGSGHGHPCQKGELPGHGLSSALQCSIALTVSRRSLFKLEISLLFLFLTHYSMLGMGGDGEQRMTFCL